GFGNFPTKPSIIYGKVTASVVADFQKTYNLKNDGIADTATLNKIEELLHSDYQVGQNGPHVVELKKQLTALGFGNFPKNPSNAYGKVTENVVKEFQAYYRLPVTGIADENTIDK